MSEFRDDLLTLSQNVKITDSALHVQDLMEETDNQIKSNLISQFGLSQLFDKFQEGGGVDTVHNVRNDVFSSDEVKAKLQPGDYTKSVFDELHGKSKKYKNINDEQTQLKKSGKLVDVYTNKKVRPNEKTDLDHVVPTKEIYADKGRLLAGIPADELANNDDNLHLVDASINRSMGAKEKSKYADTLDESKLKWKKQNERDQRNSNFSDEKKRSKDKNTNNRLKADSDAIKQTDKAARKAYDKKINSYYRGKKFLNATLNNSMKQGFNQAEKAVIGVIIYQVDDALFKSSIEVFNEWYEYNTFHERFSSFIEKIKKRIKLILKRTGEIKDAAFSGFSGGLISAISNTVINMLKTTSKNMAKLLNDSFISIVKAVRILCSSDDTISFNEKSKQAMKVVATALTVSAGVIVADALSKAIVVHAPMLAGISDIISMSISSMVLGIITAFFIYVVDNFGDVVKQLKMDFNTIMVGLTVDPQTIKYSYEKSIVKVDLLYKDLLNEIYGRYEATHHLQELAYDLDLPTADQFSASVNLAKHLGVSDRRILENQYDTQNFFNE